MKRCLLAWMCLVVVSAPSRVCLAAPPLSAKAALGKKLFFDVKLSQPNGEACATCHAPQAGFAEPNKLSPVSKGVLAGHFGSRNSPTAAYASFSPPFHFDNVDQTYVGGLFWDGRANSLSDQAQKPFLNVLEMHNHDKAQVVNDIAASGLAKDFKAIYGANALKHNQVDQAYANLADAIAAYEQSPELNPFTSKFDYYLKGQASLTAQEALGLQLFNGKANCFACHPSTIVGNEPAPLFTDFTYDNIGIPKNWHSPYLYMPKKLNPDGVNFIDKGLAETVAKIDPKGAAAEAGKFKVSTLRNLERTAPYGHNGYFLTIASVVHFYNTRDVPSAKWPAAEVPATVNHDELGNLHLTDAEEAAVVAFLKTLTDGYKP